ncbi:MAG: hypothetical protein QW814_00530 [Methanothrix sp.]
MGEQKKKLEAKNTILFLGSLVVAIMFITSYAASSNNSNSSTTTTVVYNYSGAVPMAGTANAIVSNYTNSPTISISGSSYNSSDLAVTNYLNSLENKGAIITYSPSGNQFSVLLNGSFNAFALQEGLYSRFGNNTTVSGTVYVRLPKTVKMFEGTQGFTLNSPSSEYAVKISPLPELGSNVSVHILALISSKGQFIPNQTEVTVLG